jgi:drug/metabolite transporter (DMT)-like permease
MVVATLLWGATFVVVRDTLRDLPPLTLMAARFGIASLVWALVLVLHRVLGGPFRGAREGLVAGLVTAPLTAGGYALQTIGLTETTAASSAFLTSTGTLMAAVVAWPLLGIRPGAILWVGLGLAAVGSALLSLREGLVMGAGEAWTLLGAVIYSFQIVGVAHWAARAHAGVMVAVQTVVTALIALPFSPDLASRVAEFSSDTWLRLGYLVLAGAVAAPLLQVIAQASLPPGRIALLFALEPVFALIFAVLVGGESFMIRWWVGAALILAAVLIVETKTEPKESPSRRPASA